MKQVPAIKKIKRTQLRTLCFTKNSTRMSIGKMTKGLPNKENTFSTRFKMEFLFFCHQQIRLTPSRNNAYRMYRFMMVAMIKKRDEIASTEKPTYSQHFMSIRFQYYNITYKNIIIPWQWSQLCLWSLARGLIRNSLILQPLSYQIYSTYLGFTLFTFEVSFFLSLCTRGPYGQLLDCRRFSGSSFQNQIQIEENLLVKGISRDGLPDIFTKFIGCAIIIDEISVKAEQDRHKQKGQHPIDSQDHIKGIINRLFSHLQLNKNSYHLNHHENNDNGQTQHKAIEIFIIVLTNAGANPRTVMIVSFNTDIALVAVRGPWRSIDKASCAQFYSQVMGFCCNSIEFEDAIHLIIEVTFADRYLGIFWSLI